MDENLANVWLCGIDGILFRAGAIVTLLPPDEQLMAGEIVQLRAGLSDGSEVSIGVCYAQHVAQVLSGLAFLLAGLDAQEPGLVFLEPTEPGQPPRWIKSSEPPAPWNEAARE